MASAIVDNVLKYSQDHPLVAITLDNIEKIIINKFGFDLTKFCLSFNGGKDCTVLLSLVKAIFVKNKIVDPLKVLYCVDEVFPEMNLFVEETIKLFDLDIVVIPGSDKDVLPILRSNPSCENIEGIFMGTRATDITFKLDLVSKTDLEWGDFYRINPLLDWSYKDIWQFLLNTKTPYCTLYDDGYTSIGRISNTGPNPTLMFVENGCTKYHPAHMLVNESDERLGRK